MDAKHFATGARVKARIFMRLAQLTVDKDTLGSVFSTFTQWDRLHISIIWDGLPGKHLHFADELDLTAAGQGVSI